MNEVERRGAARRQVSVAVGGLVAPAMLLGLIGMRQLRRYAAARQVDKSPSRKVWNSYLSQWLAAGPALLRGPRWD